MKILVKNGKVIDPGTRQEAARKDLYISDGFIEAPEKTSSRKPDKVIDANGMIVCPGFLDLHTHTREPGNEEAEDIKSCSEAALAGGFTSISPMPNTVPACDNQAHIRFVKERERDVKLYPVASITAGRSGKALTEMGDLRAAGVRALSDDGCGVADSELMRRAMEYASMLGLLIISHCEDANLTKGGVMNEGPVSARLGLAGMPAEAEALMVGRDIQLAELTGCRLHIAHVSTASSVELIRRAKEKGLAVTSEAAPHHFFFTEEELCSFDSAYKVNPPLRTKVDVEAIKQGLKSGVIDAIATDHAPHLTSAKEKEFDYAPFGMIGLQTALPMGLSALVAKGVLSIEEFVEKLTASPARVLGLEKGAGTLSEGAPGDITVFDPEKEWLYSAENNLSRSENSPLMGRTLKGKVTHVISGGKLVFEQGALT